MNQVLIERFVKLIANKTGLLIRPQDWPALRRKLLLRKDALKLSGLEEYYQILSRDRYPQKGENFSAQIGLKEWGKSPEFLVQTEWEQLLQMLTTGESYFFRDSGQFFLLRNIILPELIAEQRQLWQKQIQKQPTLRIWSAGCSTGEEPYSLAILLTELIPDWPNWHLCILGTDLNADSIQKAQAGVYGTWSFRTVDEQKKTAYFQLDKNGWKIQDSIKQLVKFESGNLVEDSFPDPSGEIFNMDLIVCRNVFVYFEAQAIAQVLQKFYHTLRPGGYLFTAHAELYGQELGLFSPKVFPQSVIYQRPKQSNLGEQNVAFKVESSVESSDGRSANFSSFLADSNFAPLDLENPHKPSPSDRSLNPPIDRIITQSQSTNSQNSISFGSMSHITDMLHNDSLEANPYQSAGLSPQLKFRELNRLLNNHKYSEVIKLAKELIILQPNNSELYYILARSFANLGNYLEAEKYCHQAIKFNYNWIDPYYLLAGIAEEKEDIETAKAMLKKIIYLSPTSTHAYLQMAEIYEKEGDYTRAKKMRKNVVYILEKMPRNTWLELERDEEKIRAGDLLSHIKKLLAD